MLADWVKEASKKFTFQYGEIKRRRACVSLTAAVGFTFQYGEIKS